MIVCMSYMLILSSFLVTLVVVRKPQTHYKFRLLKFLQVDKTSKSAWFLEGIIKSVPICHLQLTTNEQRVIL